VTWHLSLLTVNPPPAACSQAMAAAAAVAAVAVAVEAEAAEAETAMAPPHRVPVSLSHLVPTPSMIKIQEIQPE
jgi:hypothetical protein